MNRFHAKDSIDRPCMEGEGKERGSVAPAAAGEVVDAEGLTVGIVSTEPAGVSVDNARHAAASESPANEDLEVGGDPREMQEPSPEYDGEAAAGGGIHGAAAGSTKNEDDELFESPLATRFEFQATAANATPPSTTYRRSPSRCRKRSKSTLSSASLSMSREDGDQAPATAASDLRPSSSFGSTLPAASPSALHVAIRSAMGDAAAKASSGVVDAAACSSYRLPSRGRKQPRPDHFIPEEAEANAHAKARRSSIALDRFLSFMIHGSSEPRPQWVRDVTADIAGGHRQRQRGMEGIKIRDVSRHSEATSDPSSSSARSEPALPSAMAAEDPEKPDGSGTVFSVLAILGASLALSVVSCVLFYIVGQRKQKM